MSGARIPLPGPRVRPEWLSGLREEVLDPSQTVADPHHHLWRARPDPYLLGVQARDVGTGHDVRA